MTFRFGLFRVLTFANIIALGLLGLFAALLITREPASALFSLLMLAPAFLHNLRCLKLQQYFLRPELPVHPAMPMSINLSSIGAFIWGMLMIIAVIQLYQNPPFDFSKVVEDAIKQKQIAAADGPRALVMLRKIVIGLLGIMALHALSIIANCVLSIQYSRQLRERLPEEDETV